ncbi:MAG: (d)CMP kinase [Actinomycetales bacterium]|nr:(d)CMP kinase [Actinomycetales bacterium]
MTVAEAPFTGTVVAIDGPSGSGKSSVSRAVARALDAAYLDTGAMYRALTWSCLRDGVDLANHEAVAEQARTVSVTMVMDPRRPSVRVDGIDLSRAIREDRVTSVVSVVATNLAVRAELRRRQRLLIAEGLEQRGTCVAEGRDITTVVAPDAAVRILLTASEAARLARRATQNLGQADEASVAATRSQVVDRDRLDSTVSQFTTASDGVVRLDTSDLSFDESVAAVLAVVSEVVGRAG